MNTSKTFQIDFDTLYLINKNVINVSPVSEHCGIYVCIMNIFKNPPFDPIEGLVGRPVGFY